MPTISFAMPRDSTGLAGAVRAIRQGTDFVVPTLELASLPSLQSSAPLPSAGAFTPSWKDRYDDALVTRTRAWAFSDQAGTLYLEQSPDSVTANIITTLTVAANTPADTSWWLLTQRFYRVRYVNGATGQATFWLWLTTDTPRAGIHPGLGVLTDRSGTIATANVSQQVCAYNPGRRYLMFQNVSGGLLWINFGVAATQSQPSIQVPNTGVGSIFCMQSSFVSNEVLNVIGPTAAAPYVCKEAS